MARVLARIEGLRENPRPIGVEKLAGQERYRVRQADYRVVYAVDDASRVVEIVRIGHRRNVYRDR
ncbi:MAG: type II toxin-antitoxin system RelE/ParE family toxin [Chloroflexota bacterium]